MDATDLIRKVQSSFEKPRQKNKIVDGAHHTDERLFKNSYTLTACCRCRQKKTKCDTNLPRCLSCQRSNAVCEYYDRTKDKKISRSYVLHLQDRFQFLEKKLSKYTGEDGSPPKIEDMLRPGGFVRLNSNDETPRFLGPSSGIAMTRLVMEEATKNTDSRTIRELVPDLSERHNAARVATNGRRKSYPRQSALPARMLPSLLITENLVEVFNQKAQYLTPTLYEPDLVRDMKDIYDGSTDPYQNFILRMVLAISLLKLNPDYAGLSDSYYKAAMEYFEQVIQPKDMKTLQCLILVAQYSLLTPTQNATYYVVGLATRLCQQLGLTEEKTIVRGVSGELVDPLQLDMRRRLAWIILSMEYGLSHTMGRPNSFAPGRDQIDIKFFEAKDDEYITPQGILPGPVSVKKSIAIHVLQMRLLQAEICRVLYQKKRPEPENEYHPWFEEIQKKMKDWLDTSPQDPSWCRPWFFGRYQTMVVMLFRPSPQVPEPMTQSVIKCYDAAAANIENINRQIKTDATDITWVFVLTIFQSLNTILWASSYPEIRELHTKKVMQLHVEIALDTITRCQDRWPGAAAAAQLYSKLSYACLKSFGPRETNDQSKSNLWKNGFNFSDRSSIPNKDDKLSVAPESLINSAGPVCYPNVYNEQPLLNDQHLLQRSISTDDSFGDSSEKAFSFNINSMADISSLQVDRRFSYFPPENMQPSNISGSCANGQLPVKQESQGLKNADSIYYINPSPYSFGPSMHENQDIDIEMMGSLSHQQQEELIQDLEMNGLNEIGQLMNHSFGYENII